MLKKGLHLDFNVKLAIKLNYLCRYCIVELSEQSDLLSLGASKDMFRNYRPLGYREWSGRYAADLCAGVTVVYLPHAPNLNVAFR